MTISEVMMTRIRYPWFFAALAAGALVIHCSSSGTSAPSSGGPGLASGGAPKVADSSADAIADGATSACGGLTSCGGACVDVTSDNTNCGACGRSCGGSACGAGACKPTALGGMGQSLNSTLTSLIALGGNVYWEDYIIANGNGSGEIYCVSGTDGSSCSNKPQPGTDGSVFTLDATNFYIATPAQAPGNSETQLDRFAISNGSISVMMNLNANSYYGEQVPSGLTVDATTIYWIDSSQFGGGVNTVPLNTMSPCQLGQLCAQDPRTSLGGPASGKVVVDAHYVYWMGISAAGNGNTLYASVMQCAKTGCAGMPTPLSAKFSGVGYLYLAVDGDAVYWFQNSTAAPGIYKCAATGCGGNPTIVASVKHLSGLAVDATSVYWADADNGNVSRCASTGCNGPPMVLAGGQQFTNEFAVDAKNVYWVSVVNNGKGTGNQVFKVAK